MAPVSELLDRVAGAMGDALAFRYLPDGDIGRDEVLLGFATVRERSLQVAAALQAEGVAPGARVLLVYPPGLEFLVALLGCFYAGVIGVPGYPPDPRRLARTVPRLQGVAQDAGVVLVLSTDALAQMAQPLCAALPGLAGLRWRATDGELPSADDCRRLVLAPDSIAYLQYTSGSTGLPKGVIVPHDALAWNCVQWPHMWPYDGDAHQVSWLPTSHDLGLIWGLLAPLTMGVSATILPPGTFVARPARWLQAITAFRGTVTAAPTFGYELCARKVTDQELAGLDLSSMRAAMIAAEPVRARTVRAFLERFAPAGFAPQALCPCFGLAEATLEVTVTNGTGHPHVVAFDSAALEAGRVVPVEEGAEGAALHVGCGPAVPETEVRIVDPETCEPTDQVGEIWVRGPGVARGYWQREDISAETFGARVVPPAGCDAADTGSALVGVGPQTGPSPGDPANRPWMRTGDLGFIRSEHLFVAGRIKDLIIVRGRNLYPQDVELIVESTHRAVRPGCSAAFPVLDGDVERLGVVAEVAPKYLGSLKPVQLLHRIRTAIADQLGVAVHLVQLIGPGQIPKTSSGKIQRRATKLACEAGAFGDEVVEFRAATTETRDALRGELALQLLAARPEMVQVVAEEWISRAVRDVARLPLELVERDTPLHDLGLDSVGITHLADAIAHGLGRPVEPTLIFDAPTVRELASVLTATTANPKETLRAVEPERDVANMSDEEAEAALVALLAEMEGLLGPDRV